MAVEPSCLHCPFVSSPSLFERGFGGRGIFCELSSLRAPELPEPCQCVLIVMLAVTKRPCSLTAFFIVGGRGAVGFFSRY